MSAWFEIEGIDRLLFLTDVAFNTYPNLEEKAQIIENAVEVAQACGIECPEGGSHLRRGSGESQDAAYGGRGLN